MKKYIVEVHGIPHTFKLSDEDAAERGLSPVEEKRAPAPANKSRTPENKAK